jgi:dolichyl-phosphate beta-glucosyltransferase
VTAPYLSIVVPAYNESRRLGASLDAMRRWLDAHGTPGEIVVVDDGSTDGTAEVAEARRADDRRVRVVRLAANRGKGAAVRTGATASEGRLILVSDADLSTPIEELDRLLARMRETSSDIVIGSRALPGSRVEVGQPIWRRMMGRGFNRIIRTLTDLPYRDTQCGFKLLDREKTVPLFEKMVVDRFAYDVELLVLARLAGLRILEEPVLWRDSPDSRVAPLRSSWNMFGDVLKLRGRVRKGFYRAREASPTASPGGAPNSR